MKFLGIKLILSFMGYSEKQFIMQHFTYPVLEATSFSYRFRDMFY